MTIEQFVVWERKIALRRSTVLGVTLWMTWESFVWAREYATHVAPADGLGAAAMISAVTAPIAYLLKVVLEAYIASKQVTP